MNQDNELVNALSLKAAIDFDQSTSKSKVIFSFSVTTK